MTPTNPLSEERIEQVARVRAKLLAVESASPDFLGDDEGRCVTCYHRNPDGPEAVKLIEELAAALEAADGGEMREALEGCEAYFLALEEGDHEKHTGMLKLIRNGLSGSSSASKAIPALVEGLHAQIFGIHSLGDPELSHAALADGGQIHEAVHALVRELPPRAALAKQEPR